MSRTQADLCSTYFWTLDNELPTTVIKEYLQACSDGTLGRTIRILDARVPIPPRAYVTSTFTECAQKKLPQDFFAELGTVISRFERLTHARFGGNERPLLLTVSGDFSGTVRNIGVAPQSLPGLIHHHGAASAYELYIDFLESYSSLVLGCPRIDFRECFGIRASREGGSDGLASVELESFLKQVMDYQNRVSHAIGRPFRDSPERQLLATLIHCAKAGKEAGGDEIFVGVQPHRSSFGQSVQGVAYTRNPFTGRTDLYGVYQSAELESKCPLEQAAEVGAERAALRERHPGIFAAIRKHLPEIEAVFGDVTEAEFVADEEGNLFFTCFDRASTTAKAAVLTAMELNLAGKIDDLTAISRIKPADVEVLLHPTLDDSSRLELVDLGSVGVTAAPGTAVGHIFFRMQDAMEHFKAARERNDKQGARVILAANELLISDTPGLGMISGLVTLASGIASHAAVMARANGIACIVGYPGLEFDPDGRFMTVNGRRIEAGTLLTLEAGDKGRLFLGEGRLQNLSHQEGVVKDVVDLVGRVLKEQRVPIEVRVNINNAKDAETGLGFGADGVGLCRTENMFMEPASLREIRNIVFTQDPSRCGESFRILEESQFQDFRKIFQAMRDRTVNIRLMDLPLHDFVPQTEKDMQALAADLPHLSMEQLRAAADTLREHNPMLGLRACRFGLIQPEVYDLQIRAIVRACYAVQRELGIDVKPGIMFPLVITDRELTLLRDRVLGIEDKVRETLGIPYSARLRFRIGSMIETPAAALAADSLARVGEFFAFGTNDLTQTTLGVSRDDSAHYLPFYLEHQLLPSDPFKVLAEPVRELIETAVTRGQRVRTDASYGICGEQGGDPATLAFCLERKLNYVSCSPYRVLPTRVALIHSVLKRRALELGGAGRGELAA